MSEVILVDTSDQVLGTADKLLVHTGSGQLHRAFSVFVFNAQGEMLIQRRASEKYHFGGLWSNTVCSHPAPGEDLCAAAQGRLAYEMGLTLPLRQEFSFQYRAEDSKTNLVEHEIDHVFIGTTDATPKPNVKEVDAWGWIGSKDLARQLEHAPEAFTPWFPIAVSELHDRGLLTKE
jgi:isopentenyl-diphosphate delta-isomerase